jgi:hypothetical protein
MAQSEDLQTEDEGVQEWRPRTEEPQKGRVAVLDKILRFSEADAERVEDRPVPEKHHLASALNIVYQAAEAARATEEHSRQVESRAQALIQRAIADVEAAEARIKAAEARAAAAESRAESAEARAREAEDWLNRIHTAIVEQLAPRHAELMEAAVRRTAA